MSRFHLYFLVLVLFVVSIALFSYKAFILKFPISQSGRSVLWNLEAQISFSAQGKPAKVSLFIPRSTKRFMVTDENFISQGFGFSTATVESNRQTQWSIRKVVGKQVLFYRALIRLGDGGETITAKTPELIAHGFEGAMLAAADSLLAVIKEHSADTESFAAALLKHLNSSTKDDNVALLLGERCPELKKIEIAVRLLAHASIPARVVRGIRLEEQSRHVAIIPWIEVYDNKKWHPHDPITGTRGIADNYLPWWRGSETLVTMEGGNDLRTKISVAAEHEESVIAALSGSETISPLLTRFSLFSLPLQTQLVYRILLLVPIGAFIVVIFRNIVGIATFGTFMPVLVALAFRETELLSGVVFFSLLVGFGLAVRFYLERLQLLLVPRLACILTIVILLMVSTSIISHRLGIEHGLSVALFPMVILTMTIERMSIVWDELGAIAALRQGLGTLLVASVTYLVITFKPLEYMIFVFPELLLLVLAATLLLGRYTGYRLSELSRFKSFAEKEN